MKPVIDLVTRTVLLAGVVGTAARSLWLARHVTKPGRRVALLSILPACVAWVIFETYLLINVPIIDGAISTGAWWSRTALGFTIAGWIVMQQTIQQSERAEQAIQW